MVEQVGDTDNRGNSGSSTLKIQTNLLGLGRLIQQISNPFIEAFTAGLGCRSNSSMDAEVIDVMSKKKVLASLEDVLLWKRAQFAK